LHRNEPGDHEAAQAKGQLQSRLKPGSEAQHAACRVPTVAIHPAVPGEEIAQCSRLLRLLGSDPLAWTMLHVARDAFFEHVLATPPALVRAASEAERARVNAMADHVLPVSARAAGLIDDTRLGQSLAPYPLETIRAPTLAISARDDGFGTYDGARHVASGSDRRHAHEASVAVKAGAGWPTVAAAWASDSRRQSGMDVASFLPLRRQPFRKRA
jgi:hypothetical protein